MEMSPSWQSYCSAVSYFGGLLFRTVLDMKDMKWSTHLVSGAHMIHWLVKWRSIAGEGVNSVKKEQNESGLMKWEITLLPKDYRFDLDLSLYVTGIHGSPSVLQQDKVPQHHLRTYTDKFTLFSSYSKWEANEDFRTHFDSFQCLTGHFIHNTS